ncbi:MAG TPA: hypothetical protein VL574_14915 [Stellaceae bacterium]|nr:hypothetical protein [Stellaceae bacterium]
MLVLLLVVAFPPAAMADDGGKTICRSGGGPGAPHPEISCAWFTEKLILHLRAASLPIVLRLMDTSGVRLPDGRLHFVGMANRGPRGDIKVEFINGRAWEIDALVDNPKGGQPIRVHWDNSFASCSDFADSWNPCSFTAATH